MPISLKNMRGCASPASTAICSSTTDHRSMIRHSTSGTPRHHRLNAYLQDQYNHLVPANAAPCISELPITPRALYKKGSDALAAGESARRKSSAEIREYLSSRRRKSAEIRRSPPGSSRYLLSERASTSLALVPSEPVEEVMDAGPTDMQYGIGVVGKKSRDLVRSTPGYQRVPDRSRALVPGHALVRPPHKGSTLAAADAVDGERNQRLGLRERGSVKSPSAPSGHQVVVLRVSLHCKGCVGKLRKHLSKMEGVTSFSIDLETKRVTVVGSVGPSDVLASISKVKNAQFWPSPATSASSLSSSSSSVLSRSGFSSI